MHSTTLTQAARKSTPLQFHSTLVYFRRLTVRGLAILQDVANVVYIISGRRKSELEEWLGSVPRFVTCKCLQLLLDFG